MKKYLSWKKDSVLYRSLLAQFKLIEENVEVFEDLEVKERQNCVVQRNELQQINTVLEVFA